MKIQLQIITFTALLAILSSGGCQTAPSTDSRDAARTATRTDEEEKSGAYVFGWGVLPAEMAEPRGGVTQGTPVSLAPARQLPLPELAEATDNFSRDRAAILSLAGSYKTSFHFLETLGVYPSHEPVRPYYSWATEEVRVLEDSDNFISLQHTLVMYFEDGAGNVEDPMVMKHWRQDWTYEDTDLRTYRGGGTWARDRRSPESVNGAWTQTVWHVDDSPRYEALGRWTHDGNRSLWTSEDFWRPLPRREYSVRDDYGVLEGTHRIIITPTGWLHEQNNWKRVAGETEEEPAYRGQEIGLDRYERIDSPTLAAAADDYWETAGPYWADVREVWNEVFASRDRFTLRSKVDGRSQFEPHFEYAEKLTSGEDYDSTESKRFAHKTIERYLTEDTEATTRY